MLQSIEKELEKEGPEPARLLRVINSLAGLRRYLS